MNNIHIKRSVSKETPDDYPTPPWATRALIYKIIMNASERRYDSFKIDKKMIVREPCANRGLMVSPLKEFFENVEGSDIHDYGYGFPVRDYLDVNEEFSNVNWTITNPPFKISEEFVGKALETSTDGVAMFLRTTFLEGAGRFKRLFSHTPPTHIFQFSERVKIAKSGYDPNISSAISYAWFVWNMHRIHNNYDTRLSWIGPYKKMWEKETDHEILSRKETT